MNEVNGNGDRHVNGRFAAGHAKIGNAGRNKKTTELRRALNARITAGDMEAVAANLIKNAKADGADAATIKLFLEYAVGKPEAVTGDGGQGASPTLEQLMHLFGAIMMPALAPFPEARLAVAAALRGIEAAPDDAETDDDDMD